MVVNKMPARINSRIDAKLKYKANAILGEIGVEPSQAINMFYTQIIEQHGIPFEMKIPNNETISALNEDLSKAKRYTNIDEMFSDLDSKDTK